VVDAAIPPDKRSFPKRSLILIGATAAGFIFWFALRADPDGLPSLEDRRRNRPKALSLPPRALLQEEAV